MAAALTHDSWLRGLDLAEACKRKHRAHSINVNPCSWCRGDWDQKNLEWRDAVWATGSVNGPSTCQQKKMTCADQT